MGLIHNHASEHSDDIVAKPGAEQDALGPLLAYQSAWNLRDISGMNAAFHFPHVRIASGRIRVIEENTAFPDDFFDHFRDFCRWPNRNFELQCIFFTRCFFVYPAPDPAHAAQLRAKERRQIRRKSCFSESELMKI